VTTLNVPSSYRCTLNGQSPAGLTYQRQSGAIGGLANVRMVHAAGSPFSSTYDEGSILTAVIGGISRRVRVVNRTESASSRGEWVTNLLCEDLIGELMRRAPYPKPLNYMTLTPREKRRFDDEMDKTDAVYNAPRADLEFTPMIRVGNAYHQNGCSLNKLLKDLTSRMGLTVITNLPDYHVRDVTVYGTFFEAIVGLVSPFQPVIYEQSGQLFILDYHTSRTYGWRGAAFASGGEYITRDAAYSPIPPRVIVEGGEGPFDATRYRGPKAKDSQGNTYTSMQNYEIRTLYSPPSHSATSYFGFELPAVDFRNSSWQESSMSIPSYGPLIATFQRQYAQRDLVTGDTFIPYTSSIDAFTLKMPEEVEPDEDPETGQVLDQAAMDKISIEIIEKSRNPEGTLELKNAKAPQMKGESLWHVMNVYSRTFFNTRGDLWYTRRVEVSTDRTTGLPYISSVVEEMNFYQWPGVVWEPSVLESRTYWDSAAQETKVAPCRIEVAWGWVTTRDLGDDESDTGSNPDWNRWKSAEPQLKKAWMPVRVAKHYREYFRPDRAGVLNLSASAEEALASNSAWVLSEETNQKSDKLYYSFGMDNTLYKPGDLTRESILVYEPVYYDYTVTPDDGSDVEQVVYDRYRINRDQDGETEGAVIGSEATFFLPLNWVIDREDARAAGEITARNYFDIFGYNACLVEREQTIYRPSAGGYDAGHTAQKIRWYVNDENVVVCDAETTPSDSPIPNAALTARTMDIRVERVVSLPSATATYTTAQPVRVGIPYLVRWRDADEFAARLRALLLRQGGSVVRHQVQFPAPLFFDVGWTFTVNRVSVTNNPNLAGSGYLTSSRGTGMIVEFSTSADPQSGVFTSVTMEEL